MEEEELEPAGLHYDPALRAQTSPSYPISQLPLNKSLLNALQVNIPHSIDYFRIKALKLTTAT